MTTDRELLDELMEQVYLIAGNYHLSMSDAVEREKHDALYRLRVNALRGHLRQLVEDAESWRKYEEQLP